MSAANKELSRRFTELFSTGDEALANEILDPDVVFQRAAADGELRGIDELKAFVATHRRAFPDSVSTVEDQVAEGDRVVTRWCARGTHGGDFGPVAATGREFEIHGVTIERIAADRIVEVWTVWDELALLRQLGVVPEEAPTGA
jgi:steroid delta-isomerase-like uncharacterized protein